MSEEEKKEPMTNEELAFRPDSAEILRRMNWDEDHGGGDVRNGITSEFYRHFVRIHKRRTMTNTEKLRKNLEIRRRILDACSRSERIRRVVWTMCSRDILFWVNVFGWTYDPRNLGNPGASGLRKLPKTVPFVTWDYQDDAMRLMEWCILNGVDGLVEKSRDMGASWIFLTVFDWFYLFRPMNTFLMVSRKEDLVDKREDPDCLFWKLEFINENLPGWMKPEINRQKLHMLNQDNGSTIDGESTNGDVGRGGRRTAIGLDEFAAVPAEDSFSVLNATNDTTDCRIFNSTPKGVGNAYHEQTKREDIVRIRMHWSQHPHKREGLYYCEKGKCLVHPEGGKPHSKWYDRECRRRGFNSVAIAQELDIDYNRSGGAFFNSAEIERSIAEDSRFRVFQGELDYDRSSSTPFGLLAEDRGNLESWVQAMPDGKVPAGRYAIGIDISEGTGASYSCLSVGNVDTYEKVAQYMNPSIMPYELARLAVAMARFFCQENGEGALLLWEANGPGREFGDMVLQLGYSNIWWRKSMYSGSRSNFPGWQNTPAEKISVFGNYRRALSEGKFLNRSKGALKECFKYVTNEDGVPTYKSGSVDLGRIGQSHGDIVIADVLLNKAFEELNSGKGLDNETNRHESIPDSCLYSRMLKARSEDRSGWVEEQLGNYE